jgi:hypothetical protein
MTQAISLKHRFGLPDPTAPYAAAAFLKKTAKAGAT